MSQVLIRNLDDDVLDRLKSRAAASGKSLEQFLRELLTNAAPLSSEEKIAESRRLRAAFPAEEWDTGAAIRWGRSDADSE
jgi:plasmid stability protein